MQAGISKQAGAVWMEGRGEVGIAKPWTGRLNTSGKHCKAQTMTVININQNKVIPPCMVWEGLALSLANSCPAITLPPHNTIAGAFVDNHIKHSWEHISIFSSEIWLNWNEVIFTLGNRRGTRSEDTTGTRWISRWIPNSWVVVTDTDNLCRGVEKKKTTPTKEAKRWQQLFVFLYFFSLHFVLWIVKRMVLVRAFEWPIKINRFSITLIVVSNVC